MTEGFLIYQQTQALRALIGGAWDAHRFATLRDGELFCFEVDSHNTAGLKYTVRLDELIDIAGAEFNGQCDCYDFVNRCGPNFESNGRNVVGYKNSDHEHRTRCKHIELALREFSRRVLIRLKLNQVQSWEVGEKISRASWRRCFSVSMMRARP